MQVTGVRASDGSVTLVKDKGEYDLWSTVAFNVGQANELRPFSYAIGGNVPGTPVAVVASRLDTNLHTANQLVDESMIIYGIAIQPNRYTRAAYGVGGVNNAYIPTYLDLVGVEAATLFQFCVGGDKPFSEGMTTWFGEGGGISGFSVVNNAEVLNNNVPTPASVRFWHKHPLEISRVEKFWGLFTFPRGAVAQGAGAGGNTGGVIVVTTRLLGIRTRGVQ